MASQLDILNFKGMGFTTDMALMFYLTGSRTESTHSVTRTIERGGLNLEYLSALLAGALDGRNLFGRKPHAFAVGFIGALFGAKLLAGRWSTIEGCSADGADLCHSDFVRRFSAYPISAKAAHIAVMLIVVFSVTSSHLFRLAAIGAVYGYTIAHRCVAAIDAAILLLEVVAFDGKSSVAMSALSYDFRERLAGHKRNLLSDGWHVCLGHAAPTGGIHNYIRLSTNHQMQRVLSPFIIAQMEVCGNG